MPFETFLGRLKVQVRLEGHINEFFRAKTPTYMHGFQNNFAQVFSLKHFLGRLKVKVTLDGQTIKW